MRGGNLCSYGKIRTIIPKLSLLSLLICSTASLAEEALKMASTLKGKNLLLEEQILFLHELPLLRREAKNRRVASSTFTNYPKYCLLEVTDRD